MHRKTTAQTLTSRERKEIDAVVRRARGTERKQPATAQDSIPYQRMWPDGVCRVSDALYSKTVRFEDINYQLAQNEDKAAIFEGWCDFLNYFDASIRFQFSFHNLYGGHDALEQSILGMSNLAIARVEGVNEGNVRKSVSRGLRRLQKILKEFDD